MGITRKLGPCTPFDADIVGAAASAAVRSTGMIGNAVIPGGVIPCRGVLITVRDHGVLTTVSSSPCHRHRVMVAVISV